MHTRKCMLGLAILAASFPAIAQKDKGFTITGNLKNTRLKTVYLERSGPNDRIFLDSAKVQDGKFVFKGTLTEAEFVAIKEKRDGYNGLWFFIDNANMKFNASGDSLEFAIVKGSPAQDAYKDWDNQWEALREESLQYYRLSEQIDKMENRDSAMAAQKTVDEGFDILQEKLEKIVSGIISKYPNSPVSAFVIKIRYIDYPFADLAKREYNRLGPAARNSFYGKQIGDKVKKMDNIAIGKKPVMTLPDANGKMVSLADYKGKIVLVDFWASWCAPCRKENPNVLKAYNAFHDKGFDVLGVSLDESKAKWETAIKDDGLSWTHVSDLKAWNSPYVKDFGITGVPTSFILDREGRIVAKDLRGEELQKKLAELLGVVK